MDKQMKIEIMAIVRDALESTLENAEEKWLSADALIEQFACFSKDWLKHYGHLLPRTRAAYSNRWCYPMHKINRMLMSGEIKQLN